jgi:hypothetical protein
MMIVIVSPHVASACRPALAGEAGARVEVTSAPANANGSVGRTTPAAAAPKKHPRWKESTRKKVDHGFTPEREAAALTFVKQYHPELANLLTVLKVKEKEEYYRAVRDLFRTSERLALYREKYPERYDLELRAWQVKSRIQLIATKIKLTPDDTQLAQQLKSALIEQVDVRLEMLRHDREQQAARLKRLDEQIETLQSQRELNAERQLEVLLRAAQKRKPPKQDPRETGKGGPKRVPKETKQLPAADRSPDRANRPTGGLP